MFKNFLHKLGAVAGTILTLAPVVTQFIPSGAPKVVSAIVGAAVLLATNARKVVSVVEGE